MTAALNAYPVIMKVMGIKLFIWVTMSKKEKDLRQCCTLSKQI